MSAGRIAGRIRPKLIVPKKGIERAEYDNWCFGTHSTQPSGFIKNSYYNGLGRYVCQMNRITFKFGKIGGASRGVREFIETDLVNFSRENPGVAIYLKPRMSENPVLKAEYLNGSTHWFSLRLMNKMEVVQWLDFHVTKSGERVKRYRKPHHTDWPSVQGVWTPFLNLPSELNVQSFPNQERGEKKAKFISATEQLLKLQEEGDVSPHILQEHKDGNQS